MAVPTDMTLRTLNGKFALTAHETPQQGFPYLIRMAAAKSNVNLTFTSLPGDSTDGPSRIKIATLISAAGLSLGKERTEERSIDGSLFEDSEGPLGPITGRFWWSSLGDLSLEFDAAPKVAATAELDFLKGLGGKDAEPKEFTESKFRSKGTDTGAAAGDEVIRLQVHAKKSGAQADHSWGFETGIGEGKDKEARRYTRRILVRKDGKTEMARLVYDYLGPSA
ncbi:hypothetical protein BUE80_DR006694 [Diplocarpon rosae]|nr:hypothetical protein BUE80_DR006694 [Diplocarpon rosae]